MCHKEKYINELGSLDPNVKYNNKDLVIDIVNDALSCDDYLNIYNVLIEFLESKKAPSGVFYYPKADDVNLGYYANCLLVYAHDILDRSISHSDTCWAKNCLSCIELGYINSYDDDFQTILNDFFSTADESFYPLKRLYMNGETSKSDFVLVNGWLKYCGGDMIDASHPSFRSIRRKLRNLIKGKNDRIINLIRNIESNGWDPDSAYGAKVGVLGFSNTENKYMVFHGKHRLVALKYLISKGVLGKDIRIEYPIIRFNFDLWRQSASVINHDQCMACSPID